ncbi:uncharacterized protein LOC123467847 [Daphnia magna]|uniref:uncharacterized protein LOC123467847 n=2 Tax=Daphnia magna TaxID=35525 RepID=UPI001E1BA2C7|nr:uncharacterized protein LOC123467847 [Daphnia magna]
MHVSRDYVTIEGKEYNLSFIIIPATDNGGNGTKWNTFFRRINWTSSVSIPHSFYTLDLGNQGKHVYHPCAPFHLARDEVKDWLIWKKVVVNETTDEVAKLLMFKDGIDAKTLVESDDFKTGISSHIQHDVWATQLANSSKQLVTTQDTIKKAISHGLDNITSVVSKKIQQEFRNQNFRRNNWRDDDYDRQSYRRPDDYSRNQRQAEQPMYQPTIGTPTIAINPAPQQLNQQLAAPQGYWNPAIANQPTGLVYASPQPVQQQPVQQRTEIPYRNFITRVSTGYKPHIYPTVKALNRMLRNQVLINQSHYNISDEEIEALCLGLNFIPSDISPEAKEANSSNLNQGVSKLIRAINISLHFGDNSSTNTRKGRLTKFLPSTWDPPTRSWTQIPAVIDILDNIMSVPNGAEHVGTPQPIIEAIEKLQSETKLHILKADKGRNTVIWEADAYDREATRQLSDITTYTELTLSEYHSHLQRIHCLCETLSENLLANGYITTMEDEAIRSTETRGAYIYFLPKTHKDINKTSLTFPGRPIVATFTSGTYLLDKLITEVTAPLLPRIPGSLIDTSDLVDKLPKQKLPEGTLITTMDVTSLYPNIPWGPGIEAATSFYTSNLEFLQQVAEQNNLLRPPHPALFKRILNTVLCNSIINFKDIRFFHQTKGTAMGCCISVYFANCYMFHLTQPVIERPPGWLITFLRFIDDILIISNHTGPNELPELIKSITTEHIAYTHTQPSQSDNFLDITIHLKASTNTLEISPYTKETASGAYLHPASNHPGHVLSAIPYSQFLRLRRNSSTIDIFKNTPEK